MDERIKAIGQRIYDLMDPWELDYNTPEDIAQEVKADPLSTIEGLLDLLEQYQEA